MSKYISHLLICEILQEQVLRACQTNEWNMQMYMGKTWYWHFCKPHVSFSDRKMMFTKCATSASRLGKGRERGWVASFPTSLLQELHGSWRHALGRRAQLSVWTLPFPVTESGLQTCSLRSRNRGDYEVSEVSWLLLTFVHCHRINLDSQRPDCNTTFI